MKTRRLSWSRKHRLRKDAAQAAEAMNVHFRNYFGSNLKINSAHRTRIHQFFVMLLYGKFAVHWRESKHCQGVALDVGVNAMGESAQQWLKRWAPVYGWTNISRHGLEPWHYEYFGFGEEA